MAVHGEDRALRQLGAQRKGDVGGRPHLVAGERDGLREALPAELGVRGDARPAGLAELLVGVGELLRHLHGPVHDLHALPVAQPVDGREHVAGELGSLFEHGIDGVTVHRREVRQGLHRLELRKVLDRETHLPDGGLVVGHGTAP